MPENGLNATPAVGSPAGSTNPLVLPEKSKGGSNSYALKVAALTTLACVLLGVLAFVAFMVYDQRQMIYTLKKNIDRVNRQQQAPRAGTSGRMQEPTQFQMMDKLFNANSTVPEPSPSSRAAVKQDEKRAVSDSVSVEELMSLMEENFELPNFNDIVLGNLQSLKRKMDQSNWKIFESWLRNWILFEMARYKLAVPTGYPASPPKTSSVTQVEPKSSPA